MPESQLWYSISVTVAPEAAEAVEYAFNSLDALGTEINHLRKKDAARVTVVGYFNELPDDERFQDELDYALRVYGFAEEAASQVERSKIENTDWLAEWKKHWKPSDVGGFVIAPPWSDVTSSEKIVIRIEPNMAFGTGTHETTQLCLRAIEKYYEAGENFLDVGTGTGILAIAAAKLNLKNESEISNFKSQISDLKDKSEIANLKSQIAELKNTSEISNFKFQISDLKKPAEESEIVDLRNPPFKSQISDCKLLACDTDIDSIAIAKENAQLNNVGKLIDFRIGSIDEETAAFDFVCANLTLDVIQPLLPLLLRKACKVLVLSGILAEQRAEIVRFLADLGASDPEVNEAGEWLSVVVTRK
ncbi:MAG: 50S ribosomal protein L11 methyltransferase [Acidobacteriota bacterium]